MQKYVPVVHQDGTPLMPCKPSRARKLLKSGAAVKKWNKTGIFYIQLTIPTSKHTQPMVLGLDPGANYDGICIATKKQMQISAMLLVKNKIAKKMESRLNMRRARRWRNCRRRPKRFNNRTRKEGWLPPSIKAKIDMRISFIQSLLNIYPITNFAVEDIKIDGNKLKDKDGRKYFTWVMAGKTKLYNFLKTKGELTLYKPEDTTKARLKYGLMKTRKKGELVFTSQAVDALALCWLNISTQDLAITSFSAFRRPEIPRRQLHRFEPAKGSIRSPYGGSNALGFKKNTVVWHKDMLYRTGGTTKGRLSLHSFDFENHRITQNAKPEDCIPIFQQTWFSKKVS